MPWWLTAPDLIGRDDELEEISAFLDHAEPLPWALVLEGEAGIGKTTLWRSGLALAESRGYRVLACSPAEAEGDLAYAAVADLLNDVLPEVEGELPAPQRRALRVALLLDDPGDVDRDRRAVAAALLGALRALAARSRVLVAVDDLQWLDASSAAALAFAARRVADEPVAFLLASRPGKRDWLVPPERLRRIDLRPVSLGALRRLLEERLSRRYPRPLLRRLYEVSGGNPFYALELARVLAPEQELRPGEPLPIPAPLGDLIDARLQALPPQTLEALAAAAALADPTFDLVDAALETDAAARLRPAVAAGLVELRREHVRFAHPLFAEHVRTIFDLRRTRALHRRLAEIVPDLEQRARHLAAGSEFPDEGVADVLERAARSAGARGAPASAAELAEAASRLTPSERVDDLFRRRVAAAEYHEVAGHGARAGALLQELVERAPDGHARAVALERLGRIAWDSDTAIRLFERARNEAGDDLALKISIEQGLAGAEWVAWRDVPRAAEHLRAALRLAEELGDERTLVRVLGALVWLDAFLGSPTDDELLRRALELRERVPDLPLADDPRWAHANVLAWTDEPERARTLLETLLHEATLREEEGARLMFLNMLGSVEWRLGRRAVARRHIAEAVDLARDLELDPAAAFALQKQVRIDADDGRSDAARANAAGALAVARASGTAWAEEGIRHSLGVLALSAGDLDEAHRHLESLGDWVWDAGVREPCNLRSIPDEIEVLILLGRRETAEDLLERFEREAQRLDRASGLATAARCRALLAAAAGDLEAASDEFRESLRQHDRLTEPSELARTLLAFGVVQRRAKQRRAARETLGRALALFEELGAMLWAERTRGELARIGGRTRASGLTPTERRLAELVTEGLSNKQIAAALFVTPKTVSTQLSRVYAKLGVHSRTELVRRLGERTASKV